jgi:type VII secretion protein EccB
VQTQKDHVHAYQFLMQRMTTALVVGDPSNMELPTKRGRSGMLIGALIALLIVIGFGVYGLIVPGGNKAWQQKGAILVEKESGTRYVYVNGVLMATPNLASAMLIQGDQSKVSVITRASLSGLARGPQMGIPGAPDTVPRPQDLLPGSWLLCPSADANGRPGTSMNLDDRARTSSVPDDQYVPVQSMDGKLFVIWKGVKHRVPDTNSLVVFGLAATRSPFMPDLWLSLIPDGPELSPAVIPDAGKPGQNVAGAPRRIGDLFTHDPGNGTQQRYVLLQEGLAPLSATEFALLSAQPGKSPVEIDAQSILTAPFSPDHTLLLRLPDLVKLRPVENVGGTACLRQTGSGAEVTTTVVIAPGADKWPPVSESGARVTPNRGLLVAELPIPNGQKVPNRYLITDRGKRFLIPDNDSIQALGLGGVQPVPMRTEVLSTIPAGPALSRSAVVVEQGG